MRGTTSPLYTTEIHSSKLSTLLESVSSQVVKILLTFQMLIFAKVLLLFIEHLTCQWGIIKKGAIARNGRNRQQMGISG